MTIANEITKLQTNLSNAYTSCNNKGATMPSSKNFDNLATTINSIPTGGGGGGITPTGTIEITENGTYDVTNYASADVTVAGSGGGGIKLPEKTKAILLDLDAVIGEEELKGAFQHLTVSTFSLIYSEYQLVILCDVESKGLQEAFKGNTSTKTVILTACRWFAADALLDCFVNSAVTRITFAAMSDFDETTGYDNKWGAPNATITTIMTEK